MDEFSEIQRLREDYEATLDEADARRATYHDSIRKLYVSGRSLSEIAEKLGISRQRVHEIVGKDASTRRRKRKRVVGGASIFIAMVVAGSALWIWTVRAHQTTSAFKVHSPPCVVRCLSSSAAAYQTGDGRILAIFQYSPGPDGFTMTTRKAVKGAEALEMLFVRDHFHQSNQNLRVDAPADLAFVEVTKDRRLASVIRGNLADFHIAGGRIVLSHRFLAAELGSAGIVLVGLVAFLIFDRKVSRVHLSSAAPSGSVLST